jgi:hypothetical protein
MLSIPKIRKVSAHSILVLLLALSIFTAIALSVRASTALAYETATEFRYPLNPGGWFLGQAFDQWNAQRSGFHLGEDLVPSDGRAELPVYAPANGIVRHSGFQSGYGFVLVIEHRLPDHTYVCSVLGHLKAADLVPRGTEVIKGQLIGRLSFNPLENGGYPFSHLHFGIRSGPYSTARDTDGGWRYRGYAAGVAIRALWHHPTNFINARLATEPAPQNGSLRVNLAPREAVEAGAQWRIAGNPTWQNSGETISHIPAGSYTVEFRAVSGWDRPAGRSVSVQSGQTALVSENYRLQSSPQLRVSSASISFGLVRRLTYASPRSYLLTGLNLTMSVQIQAPSGYWISTSSSGGYGRALTLQPRNGAISQRIFVSFMPIGAGLTRGLITHSSPGAENVSVRVSGWGR